MILRRLNRISIYEVNIKQKWKKGKRNKNNNVIEVIDMILNQSLKYDFFINII